MARIDAEVLEGTQPSLDPDETARDRLFDVMMRRYDALRPYRAAFRAIRRAGMRDPILTMSLGPALRRSMRAMLEAAAIASDGALWCSAANGLTPIHYAVSRVFDKDESQDLSATMAALDRRLKMAEKWAELFERYTKSPAQNNHRKRRTFRTREFFVQRTICSLTCCTARLNTVPLCTAAKPEHLSVLPGATMYSSTAFKNPFADFDFSKIASEFKLPTINVETFVEASRKNVAAITAANQTAVEAIKAIAQRQTDMLRAAVEDFSKVGSEVLAAATVEEKATKQIDFVKKSYDAAVANGKELAELYTKGQTEALAALSQRVTELGDEVKAAIAAKK